MRHLVHGIVAAVGAVLAVLLSSALTSAFWGGMSRVGPEEILTIVVCTVVFWSVLEVEDLLTRRGLRASRREAPRRAGRSPG
ncbi:hypothetical protein CFK38_13990 [Brachybacterium vulturis]|uniref:Uncharacterized protein n=2 Tax=Brachybacterium vulturis TaxID=2017484 RepID=A0A291GPT4_9MICO|nr:hypothetical protein CFK38_13990 [Brachybacterium vulturis]